MTNANNLFPIEFVWQNLKGESQFTLEILPYKLNGKSIIYTDKTPHLFLSKLIEHARTQSLFVAVESLAGFG